jgi:DNA (cytosine-5)-methyltransferase 1
MSYQKRGTYTVVDLFAGAGGLSYGFLQTGRYKVAAAFELNKNAQKTYLRNHGEKVAMYSDVEDALSDETKKALGQIDVVVGGPPCQGFSNANRQKNHAISQNNSLVKKFVQAVLHLEPMAFVMENVSMLQSNVHRFYVTTDDRTTIEQYGIPTETSEIHLLEDGFEFDGVVAIVQSLTQINNYLWDEDDYLVLNVVYKMRNNQSKLQAALSKHQRRLLMLAAKLTEKRNENDSIIHQWNLAGDAIQQYFNNKPTEKRATDLCTAIEKTIVYQRMLSKAKEIHDNHIVVSEYSEAGGLVAYVTSMAVIDYIEKILGASNNGYSITKGVLLAATFGAPQKRMRFVIMGIKKDKSATVTLPVGTFTESNYRTVEDAIKDIQDVKVALDVADGDNGTPLPNGQKNISDLAMQLRDSDVLYNHVSTATTDTALERFRAIKQGGNFHSLSPELKTTYSDVERTQNTIYLRFKYNEPSGTVVNVRKSMWIHPVNDRAISVREAARLQTFPDSFVFCGTKDSQYQQVSNAVPPILAKAIAAHLVEYLDK